MGISASQNTESLWDKVDILTQTINFCIAVMWWSLRLRQDHFSRPSVVQVCSRSQLKERWKRIDLIVESKNDTQPDFSRRKNTLIFILLGCEYETWTRARAVTVHLTNALSWAGPIKTGSQVPAQEHKNMNRAISSLVWSGLHASMDLYKGIYKNELDWEIYLDNGLYIMMKHCMVALLITILVEPDSAQLPQSSSGQRGEYS